jgi:hypothetical protein
MRKLIPVIALLALLLPGFGVTPAHANENPGKTISAQEIQLANIFSFEQLGYSEKLLIGPFDAATLFFSLPANMKLAHGSSVLLKYGLAWSGGLDNTSVAGVGGTLLVYFNDELIDTIILNSDSPPEKEIVIPDKALDTVERDGRNRLRLFLNADVNCRYDNIHTTLLVSKNSQFNLQYAEVAPVADLALLPRPIYQPDSIVPNSALVVIPDAPEAFELQAALTAMAGLGSITNGDLLVGMVTASQLNEEMVASKHLIFVGLAKNFPSLQVANLPIAVSDNGLALDQDHDADGVVQIAVSPWSQSNVILFVGGNSEDGVIKASQAFSTGKIIAVEKPDVSLIATVNPSNQDSVISEDKTFKDLGYESQTMGLFGESYLSYTFYTSPEQASSEGAYIDLVVSHSDLINYDGTGLSVRLNNEVVGGLQLSKETPATLQIKLVPGVIRRGINRLEIISDIIPYFTCYSTDLSSTWVTISETSSIHLPISGQKLNIGDSVNLRDFPYMFLGNRNLSDLAFVVAPNDPVSWDYAARVAYYIGAKGGVPLVNLYATYADNIPDEILQKYNLLTFGQASNLPFISKINDLLPAPFKPGSDEAVQPSMQVNYSLLPDTSVGYLQLLPSPWNSDRVIMAVLGNNLDGIPMAGTTLMQDDLVARLAGNFAVLYADQVVTTDTRLGISKESIVGQLPVAVTVTPIPQLTVPPTAGVKIESRPSWILPVFGVVTVGIVGFLLLMLRKELGTRMTRGETKPREEDAASTSGKES